MSRDNATPLILMAEDDADDRLLAQEALKESRTICSKKNILSFVQDGVELLDYLRGEGNYSRGRPPRPNLILLDLNMPRKDGREALAELKSDPVLRGIPVVILTTSQAEEDILQCYRLGAASYLTKPVTFEGLVKLMRVLREYWLDFVKLPNF